MALVFGKYTSMKQIKIFNKYRVAILILMTFYTVPLVVKAQLTKVYVGTTNGEVQESLAFCILDENKETLTLKKRLNAGVRPGYIALNNGILYTVSTDFQENNQHTVRAFQLLDGGNQLKMISEVSSQGINPCHIATSIDGNRVYAANYNSGSIVSYAINPDGSLGYQRYFQQFEGSSVDPKRQQEPHAHYINTTKDNKFVLTADLGTDKVMIHRIDQHQDAAINEHQPFLRLPPGSGPRHLEFHPNNQWIYVLNELNSTLTTVVYQDGNFKVMNTVSALPSEFQGVSYSAAVRIHPNGSYLYTSNRGSDSISVFEIGHNGTTTLIQNFSDGLGWVRDFNISPSGKFIIAGNEKQSQAVLLKLDSQGKIQEHLATVEMPSPSCFVFF